MHFTRFVTGNFIHTFQKSWKSFQNLARCFCCELSSVNDQWSSFVNDCNTPFYSVRRWFGRLGEAFDLLKRLIRLPRHLWKKRLMIKKLRYEKQHYPVEFLNHGWPRHYNEINSSVQFCQIKLLKVCLTVVLEPRRQSLTRFWPFVKNNWNLMP